MSGLKILLAHNYYLIGGGERQVFAAELSLLRNHGHEVDVYIEDNQRIAELGRLHTMARTIWSNETYRNMRNKLRAGQFDVVHVHNFFPLISPSIYYAAHAEQIPVVQTLHNFRLLCSNGLLFREGVVCEACVGRAVTWPGIIHACYRDSRGGSATVTAMHSFHRAIKTWDRMIDTYIALTEFSRQKFIEGGLPETKIRVKPNFMTRDPNPGSGQGNYALFVGRLSPEKGVETLLAAWRLLGDTVPLKIIGQGPLQDKVVAAAETMPSVDYLGYLENDRVLNIMQDALFLVFPSLLYENFPMTIVEAFATGLAVLASNLGNSANLVQPWQTGLHFKTGDPTDLAKQAVWLMNNRDKLMKMRISARATYEAQLTPSKNYRIMSEIYQETLKKHEVGVQKGH
jgi:glycosyltransferase involved in cell wall biosynthesis